MKKSVKSIVTGLLSISLLSAITYMAPTIVNADSVSNTDSTLDSDTSQQTFIIPDYSNFNLPSSNFDPVSTGENFTDEAKFDDMSIEELNQYIDDKVQQEEHLNSNNLRSMYGESKVIVTTNVLKSMWKAAGAIAKKVGYPCTGTLIQYSASGKNYTEWSKGGGLLASHIKKTTAYKKAKKRNAKSIEFTKSDSKDLFYALHLVSSNFHYTKKHPVHIHDKFDFQFMASYKNSPFTSAINNWGYLCSHINVLYPSKINIYF